MPAKRARPYALPSRSAKRIFRRRAVQRRVKTRMSRSKRGSLSLHRYSRYCAATTEIVDSTELDVAYDYKFNQILGNSEFAALYDRYRIDRIVTSFQLVNNPSANAYVNDKDTGNSANFYPKMWYVADHDDANTEAISVLKERSGVKCRILQPNMTISVVTRPAIAAMMYKTATTTGYGPKWGQWIDMTNTDVPHYGLKVAFDTNALDPADTRPFRVRVENKFFFTCKDVR